MGVILRAPLGGLPNSVTAYRPDTGFRLGLTTYEFFTDLAKAGRFKAFAIFPSSAIIEPGPVAIATAAFCKACNLASMALLEFGGGKGGGGTFPLPPLLFPSIPLAAVGSLVELFQLLASATCHDVGRDCWAACAAALRLATVCNCKGGRRGAVSVWLIDTEAG